MRLLFTALLYCLTPALLVRLWLRGRTLPGYRQRWSERFGHWPAMPEGALWLHSVSVGETIAARPFVERWLSRHPDIPVIITTMTPTGSETVQALFGDKVHHAYLPWDFPHVYRRLIPRLKPRALVIMETELWPNLIGACDRHKVPVFLVNGRLSERSARGYHRLRALTRPMLQQLTGIAAQHWPDAERFQALGVPPKNIEVTGSIKFDLSISNTLTGDIAAFSRGIRDRPVWVAASTHDGEEADLLEVHRRITTVLPNALMILVPRHPDRFETVASIVDTSGLPYSRRSQRSQPRDQDKVYLADSLGELMVFFGAAQVAVMGNTFNGGGGHNPIEPAALGKPVLVGPSYTNFQSIISAMQKDQGIIVTDSLEALEKRLLGLLKSRDLRDTFGQRAYVFYQHQQGALQRMELWLDRHLNLIDPGADPSRSASPPTISSNR
ncbi:lipid IV(A) 3-deoxy-D-manno-octulosonic acid transferase [Saccharospirillum impatiens]|uniref:lipid IV(A) 3-deoxy-D-manno-octulosonic acid transferase n=1 Tax=Saccharospirillum impatiens TaxID=169438 RepID=UPI0003FAE973|nr:lipid IV(A) 3-deoxy-D-manno-octulosonic acid transferase [Saccharospirillum impatiens]